MKFREACERFSQHPEAGPWSRSAIQATDQRKQLKAMASLAIEFLAASDQGNAAQAEASLVAIGVAAETIYNQRYAGDCGDQETQAAPAGPSPSFAALVHKEVARARILHAPLHSLHEGFSVILEEVDEFWAEVKKKREARDSAKILAELVQVGAMCQRLAEDCVVGATEVPR
jgi:hypothetical protein